MVHGKTAPQPSMRVSWLYRTLYWSYSRGSMVSLFFCRRVTPVGWGALSLLLLTAILGVDLSKSALYQVFCLVAAALAISVLWAWGRRGRLVVERDLPSYATVDEPLSYFVTITNRGRHTLRGFLLTEWPPDPRPSLLSFARIAEPGEERRNAFDRLFVYYRWRWLRDQHLLFDGGEGVGQQAINPGDSLRVRMQLVPRRRGVVPLFDMRLRLPDPLGLFQRCRRISGRDDSVIVFPRTYHLPPLNLGGHACFEHGGAALSNTAGPSGEFLGLRDYRNGDPMRRIHWKGWARTGRPIVREFEEVSLPHYALVLDNCVENGDDNLLEYSISVAASFARAIDTRNNTLDLVTMRDEGCIVSEGQGVARPKKIMKALAEIQGQPEKCLGELESVMRRHGAKLTAGIVVLTGWTASRADLLQDLARTGLEMTALILCWNAPETRARVKETPLPCRHHLLEPQGIQEKLLKVQL